MKMKKFLSVVLAACMLISVCGCSNNKKEENVKKVELNAPGEFPIAKEKTKITIGVQQNAMIEDWETNALTLELEEKANVDIEFIVFPSADAESKIAAMVASQTELPDILTMETVDLTVYYDTGIAIPLTDYYNNPDMAYYFNKRLENSPEEREYIINAGKSPDGENYGVMRYTPEIGNEYPFRMWINKTWLDKLDLEMPTTTDEYYDVLKAFVEKDPNGNGKKDEIGLIGSNNGWNQKPQDTLMNAFIYNDPNRYNMTVKNGKIDVVYNKPEYKKGLEYMHKLVKDGLLSPQSFTQDVVQLKSILENPEVQQVGSIVAGSMSVFTPESERKKDFVAMPPLTGPDGVCYSPYSQTVPNCNTIITKYCDNPELAFRMLDYLYDETMSVWQRFGQPGVDWDTEVSDIKGLYEDTLGIKCGFRQITNISGSTTQNSYLGNILPAYRPAMSELSIQGIARSDNKYDYTIYTADAVPLYMNKHPKELVPALAFKADEAEQVNDIKASLDTFRSESVVRFITGDKPFSEWDSYVKELEKIGLKEYIKLSQKVYDRMNSAK